MPQGFKNSPAIFQSGMSIVLSGLKGKICHVYLDDILIWGRDHFEHNKNLREVLDRLDEYNLEINEEKSVMEKSEVVFLGFSITKNQISPKVERAQGILDFPLPDTKKKLQSFLGLINSDREFVPGLAELSKPLYNLL